VPLFYLCLVYFSYNAFI